MASMSSGMANGTGKPEYINSFMSFLETQDDNPDSPQGQETANSIPAEEEPQDEKESDGGAAAAAAEDDPLEEAVTPTDHAPDQPPDLLSDLASDNFPDLNSPTPDDQATPDENDPDDPASFDDDPDDPPPEPQDLKPAIILDQETSSEDSQQSIRRNVARRGRKKSAGQGGASPSPTASDVTPQRETPPRRASRLVKRYGQLDAESDVGAADSDPDFHLSDSDDDPDFNPLSKKTTSISDDEESVRPSRRGRGRGRGIGAYRGIATSLGRGRGVKRSLETNDTNNTSSKTTTVSAPSPPKRRGRPPTYQTSADNNTTTTTTTTTTTAAATTAAGVVGGGSNVTESGGQDNTVTSTDEKKAPSKLSSAYNYAGGRVQRQSHTIKLPEGPQLTSEQLAMVESQFKSGEFVMAKKDMDMMEHPPIWRIDGKSLLQKFQAFEKDGKTLYRNISTYSGWTSQAKALYVGVRVTFVFQSRYDTVVELVSIKNGEEEDKEKPKDTQEPNWTAVKKQQDFQISEDLRSHMPSFEIYLQTLISQALDNNFLMEIYAENDDYFVERVKVIDELAEQRKNKILEIIDWNDKFKSSLDIWPCINVMLTSNTDQCQTCQACGKRTANKLSQLYGQPYNQQTLRSQASVPSESDNKLQNFEVCDRCSNVSQMYNKVTHQKYDYYSQCKSTVTNMRVTHPGKHTTTILRDLLANDIWITGLFRSMCTTWIKVDRLHHEETQKTEKQEDSAT